MRGHLKRKQDKNFAFNLGNTQESRLPHAQCVTLCLKKLKAKFVFLATEPLLQQTEKKNISAPFLKWVKHQL